MPDATTKPADDRAPTCEIHKTPMVRWREHIGDGNHRWSEWFCPLCREIEAKKPFDPNAHLPKADTAPKAPAPVSPPATKPAG